MLLCELRGNREHSPRPFASLRRQYFTRCSCACFGGCPRQPQDQYGSIGGSRLWLPGLWEGADDGDWIGG